MTYDQLVAFIATVDEGGFKAASRTLHISQPSISVAIKKLEEEFGFLLFSRAAYRPKITEAGQAFYELAVVAVRQMTKLEVLGRHLGSGQESELAIALTDACPTEFTVALLKGFFQKHQSTKLKLKFEGVRGGFERVLLDEAYTIFFNPTLEETRITITPIYFEHNFMAKEDESELSDHIGHEVHFEISW